MSDPIFSASVDASSVLALFDRIAQSADFVCKEVGRDTAKRIVAEADRRVRRATGQTEAGIHWELTRDGKGYIVLAYRAGVQDPVDRYLEDGTQYMLAKPFFFASAELESAGHVRRLEARLQEFLDSVGR
jgi:hypothetical protein